MIPQNLLKGYKLLLEFFEKEGFLKARNPKITQINAHVFLFGAISQKNLQKLTYISQSTLSRILSKLVRNNILSISPKENNKSLFYYFSESRNIIGLKSNIDYARQAIKDSKSLISLISEFPEDYSNNSSYKILKNQIIETLIQIGLTHYRFSQLISSKQSPSNSSFPYSIFHQYTTNWKNPDIYFLKASKLQEPYFDKTLTEIETHYIKTTYGKMHESMVKRSDLLINAYCTTRKIISQPTLHKLTGFSIPLISKILKKHIQLGQLIMIDPHKSVSGRTLYYTKALPLIQMENEIFYLTELLKFKPKFQSFFSEIKNFSPHERIHPLYYKFFWVFHVLLSDIIPEFEKRLDMATSIYKNGTLQFAL
ncbi:MAG: hypothetical protein K9W44_05955 [Candidatus Lokiarchaeota archaeon]|nr:hypothetical protein [Candidatus Harpocratesius repetitus]